MNILLWIYLHLVISIKKINFQIMMNKIYNKMEMMKMKMKMKMKIKIKMKI